MKQHHFILAGITCGLLLCSTAIARDFTQIDGIVAMVNERPITRGEIRIPMESARRRLHHQYTGMQLQDRLDEAFDRILNGMIESALILEEFKAKERPVPETAVDEHIQNVLARDFGGNRSTLLQTLAEEGLSMQEWRDQIRDNIAISMMRFEYVRPITTAISPRQLRAAYEERIDEFREDAATHLSIISLSNADGVASVRNEDLAQQIVAKAREGTDFDELARIHSTDGFASQGGSRGWIDPVRYLRPDLAEVVLQLAPGEIGEPVFTPEAWLIVKVKDRREAGVISFAEVRDQLMEELRQAEEERAYQAWINRLRNRHHVRILGMDEANPF